MKKLEREDQSTLLIYIFTLFILIFQSPFWEAYIFIFSQGLSLKTSGGKKKGCKGTFSILPLKNHREMIQSTFLYRTWITGDKGIRGKR